MSARTSTVTIDADGKVVLAGPGEAKAAKAAKVGGARVRRRKRTKQRIVGADKDKPKATRRVKKRKAPKGFKPKLAPRDATTAAALRAIQFATTGAELREEAMQDAMDAALPAKVRANRTRKRKPAKASQGALEKFGRELLRLTTGKKDISAAVAHGVHKLGVGAYGRFEKEYAAQLAETPAARARARRGESRPDADHAKSPDIIERILDKASSAAVTWALTKGAATLFGGAISRVRRGIRAFNAKGYAKAIAGKPFTRAIAPVWRLVMQRHPATQSVAALMQGYDLAQRLRLTAPGDVDELVAAIKRQRESTMREPDPPTEDRPIVGPPTGRLFPGARPVPSSRPTPASRAPIDPERTGPGDVPIDFRMDGGDDQDRKGKVPATPLPPVPAPVDEPVSFGAKLARFVKRGAKVAIPVALAAGAAYGGARFIRSRREGVQAAREFADAPPFADRPIVPFEEWARAPDAPDDPFPFGPIGVADGRAAEPADDPGAGVGPGAGAPDWPIDNAPDARPAPDDGRPLSQAGRSALARQALDEATRGRADELADVVQREIEDREVLHTDLDRVQARMGRQFAEQERLHDAITDRPRAHLGVQFADHPDPAPVVPALDLADRPRGLLDDVTAIELARETERVEAARVGSFEGVSGSDAAGPAAAGPRVGLAPPELEDVVGPASGQPKLRVGDRTFQMTMPQMAVARAIDDGVEGNAQDLIALFQTDFGVTFDDGQELAIRAIREAGIRNTRRNVRERDARAQRAGRRPANQNDIRDFFGKTLDGSGVAPTPQTGEGIRLHATRRLRDVHRILGSGLGRPNRDYGFFSRDRLPADLAERGAFGVQLRPGIERGVDERVSPAGALSMEGGAQPITAAAASRAMLSSVRLPGWDRRNIAPSYALANASPFWQSAF